MLKYINGYNPQLKAQVQQLIEEKKLGDYLLSRYPDTHSYSTDKALYGFVQEMKNRALKNAAPLSKILYDTKIRDINKALGTHTFVSRVQGGKLKAKHEIRISHLFRKSPEAFLRMIVAHELAHLREKEHNKAFYKLCIHMEPHYHQLEFDTRLYLIYKEHFGELYPD
ncbi:MAG: M48 family metallopeptidase [Campylobacterales bacterium]|nr:M48 family metallopeptidase [Campylobacterales bacterium]HEO98143.1 M48 family peptidase [Campylobacterota bacterium]